MKNSEFESFNYEICCSIRCLQLTIGLNVIVLKEIFDITECENKNDYVVICNEDIHKYNCKIRHRWEQKILERADDFILHLEEYLE